MFLFEMERFDEISNQNSYKFNPHFFLIRFIYSLEEEIDRSTYEKCESLGYICLIIS